METVGDKVIGHATKPTLEVPTPRLSYKLAFLLGGMLFAAASYLVGTVLYEMELSLIEQGVLSSGRVTRAVVNIFRKHLFTFAPWVMGTTAVSIALGYLFDKQVQYRRAAERLATTDSLTMLATRPVLMTGIAREIARAERGLPNVFSVLMLDIDDFKKYNDTYGHLGGDRVLQNVCAVVRDSLRKSDVGGRFGGEEIMVVLAGADSKSAALVAERLRAKIEAETDVTVSIGVASYLANGKEVSELIRAADEAMYEAKRTGKNKVCPASAASNCR